MPQTIALLDRAPLALSDALAEDTNVVKLASYVPATNALYASLLAQRAHVEAVVRQHLGLCRRRDKCTVLPWQRWIRGAFNVCIVVEVQTGARPWWWWWWGSAQPPDGARDGTTTTRLVIVRCPMPYKVGENLYPGSVDEKLGCEVAAYAWMQANCADIRIPHLYGFGTTRDQHFTHIDHLSIVTRLGRRIGQWLHRVWRRPLLTNYVPQRIRYPIPKPDVDAPPPPPFSSAYVVLEYLSPDTTGRMLSETFPADLVHEEKRRNLFRGMSRIILSLARIPQPRIGSFSFDAVAQTVTLTGRPLFSSLKILENDGAEQFIAPGQTYGCTDAYVSDYISFHDRRFLAQPNATYADDDCRGQLAVKTLLRVLAHRYIDRARRSGPYFLQLTDLHASNVLVDDRWNVNGLIDLEWMCSLPAENMAVPYWLTGLAIDQIEGGAYDDFDTIRREFMDVFEEEEGKAEGARGGGGGGGSGGGVALAPIMNAMWDSKGVWFWHCLSSVNAMYFILREHVLPATLTIEAEPYIATFWGDNVDDVVKQKLQDKKAYDEKLRALFNTA